MSDALPATRHFLGEREGVGVKLTVQSGAGVGGGGGEGAGGERRAAKIRNPEL